MMIKRYLLKERSWKIPHQLVQFACWVQGLHFLHWPVMCVKEWYQQPDFAMVMTEENGCFQIISPPAVVFCKWNQDVLEPWWGVLNYVKQRLLTLAGIIQVWKGNLTLSIICVYRTQGHWIAVDGILPYFIVKILIGKVTHAAQVVL